MRKRYRHALAAGPSSVAILTTLLMMTTDSVAKAQQADAGAHSQALNMDTIVVTGFRQALESAINEKRSADIVVESVTAEDIGKLPDASIAESIARLPGLTSQRLSGRTQVISIRGFAPDFSTTLLNGREQTSTGDNRAVEYDQYPSEAISQVNVYKTPSASLIGQGLSGTVDLRTMRPLSFGKEVISLGARAEYTDLGKLNSGSTKYGYRIQGTYVDQFANDTLGVALAASYVNSPYQVQEFNAWGYGNYNGNALIGGSKSYVTSTELTRLGLQGTLEWKPVDNFTTSFDAFYSDLQDDQIKRGIELPLAFGSDFDPIGAVIENGVVTSGKFRNVEGVVRNDAFKREAKLYSFGWNGKWTGADGWHITGDIGYSRTDRNELILETNAGTARGSGTGATDTISFNTGRKGTTFEPGLNYSDPNLIKLTSPLGWGGTQRVPGSNLAIINGQDGYYNNRKVEDELWQYRLDVEKEIESAFVRSVQVGINYTKRDKSLKPEEYFLGLKSNTDGRTDVRVPDEYILRPTDLSYLGLGPMISYDPHKLLEGGLYNLVPNIYQDVATKGYDIAEDIVTAYVQGNVESDLGWATLTGNVGTQVVWTKQESTGVSASYIRFDDVNQVPVIGLTPISGGDKFVDVLPSFNLSLRFPSELVVRLGASRQMMRPRLDELRISRTYGASEAEGIVTGEGGNPNLRPWKADALDLTFEKYFGRKGYLAAQFFYKQLKTYIYNQDIPYNYDGLPLGPTGRPVSRQGRLTMPMNGEGGKLYGLEIAGTLPLEIITPALEGFGLTGGASYTKTSVQPNPTAKAEDLPGYSRWVANGTVYFERAGFSARTNLRYRSSFVGELSGFGAVRTRRRAAAELLLDAQIGYDFQEGHSLEGLSLFLQGQNLSDEPFVTSNPDQPMQVIDYQIYGRRFLAGFSYKF